MTEKSISVCGILAAIMLMVCVTACGTMPDGGKYVEAEGLDQTIVPVLEEFPASDEKAEGNISLPEAEAAGTETETIKKAVRESNVMSRPAEDASSIGSVKEGEDISLIDLIEDGGWYKIDYNGRVAYIRADAVETASDDVATSANAGTGNTGNGVGSGNAGNNAGTGNRGSNAGRGNTGNGAGTGNAGSTGSSGTENTGSTGNGSGTENAGSTEDSVETEDVENPGDDAGNENAEPENSGNTEDNSGNNDTENGGDATGIGAGTENAGSTGSGVETENAGSTENGSGAEDAGNAGNDTGIENTEPENGGNTGDNSGNNNIESGGDDGNTDNTAGSEAGGTEPDGNMQPDVSVEDNDPSGGEGEAAVEDIDAHGGDSEIAGEDNSAEEESHSL